MASLSISSARSTDGSQCLAHTHSDQVIPLAGASTSLPHQEAGKGLRVGGAWASGASPTSQRASRGDPAHIHFSPGTE